LGPWAFCLSLAWPHGRHRRYRQSCDWPRIGPHRRCRVDYGQWQSWLRFRPERELQALRSGARCDSALSLELLHDHSSPAQKLMSCGGQTRPVRAFLCFSLVESCTSQAERDELKGALQKEQALRDQAGSAAAEGDEEAKRLQTALQELQKSNKELELEKEDLAEQLMRAKAECMQHEESSQTGSARASLLEEELQREQTKLEQLGRQMSEASERLAKAEAERDELQASSCLEGLTVLGA